MLHARIQLLLLAVLLAACGAPERETPAPRPDRMLAQLRSGFEANRGQTDDAVRFLLRRPDYVLFVTDDELVFSLRTRPDTAADAPARSYALRMGLPGGGSISARDPLPHAVSYFLGAEPDGWVADVPTYAGITYAGLGSGTRLDLSARAASVSFRAVLDAGVDPGTLRITIAGAGAVTPVPGGAVEIWTPAGTLRLGPPRFLQRTSGGDTVRLAGRYVVAGDAIAFDVPDRDPSRPLVIDPVIDVTVFLDGVESDYVHALAGAGDDALYVAGSTQSPDFPASAGEYTGGGADAFVTRLRIDDTAMLVPQWTRIFGGAMHDEARDVAVDGFGRAYVVGSTGPTTDGTNGFPIFNVNGPPAQASYGGGLDAFLVRVRQDGEVYSAVPLGGREHDWASAVAVEHGGGQEGRVFVGGGTLSSEFGAAQETVNAFRGPWDGFLAVTDLQATALQAVHYVGGSGPDDVSGVATRGGRVYLAGSTASVDFPTRDPLHPCLNRTEPPDCDQIDPAFPPYDAFLTVLTPHAPDYHVSTWIGGGWNDRASDLALGANGAVYIVGTTGHPLSGDYATFPSTPGTLDPEPVKGTQDGFVVRALPPPMHGTFLAGDGWDNAAAVAVGPDGHVWVGGTTSMPTAFLPPPDPTPIGPLGGLADAYLARLTPELDQAIWWPVGSQGNDRGTAVAMLGEHGCLAGTTNSAGSASGVVFVTCPELQVEDAMVVLSVEDDPDPAAVGDSVTYMATLSSTGGVAAADVRLTGELQDKPIAIHTVTSEQGTCTLLDGGTLVDCQLGSMAPSTATTVTLVGEALAPGPAEQRFHVSWAQIPLALTEPEQTTVAGAPPADLAVDVQLLADPVVAGETALVSVTGVNIGGAAAPAVRLDLARVAGAVELESAQVVGLGPMPCALFDDVIRCSVGPLAPGASAEARFVVRPTAAAGAQELTLEARAGYQDQVIVTEALVIDVSG